MLIAEHELEILTPVFDKLTVDQLPDFNATIYLAETQKAAVQTQIKLISSNTRSLPTEKLGK